MRHLSKTKFIALFCFGLIIASLWAFKDHARHDQNLGSFDRPNQESIRKELVTKPVEPTEITTTHKVKPQSNLYSSLRELSLQAKDILDLISAAKIYTDLEKVPANFAFKALWESQSKRHLKGLIFDMSPTERIQAHLIKPQGWQITKEDFPIVKERRTFAGNVSNSLWESAQKYGVEPSLIVNLTEIFAWQVDFNREVRPGDQWRLVVEEKFARNQSIGWGEILAAEYVNQGEVHTAVRFTDQKTGSSSYYSPDGQSLKRMFLKSPIKFGRISSRFSKRRLHPVLKKPRPHLGVDYAAPTGTPIRAVGKGTIVTLGRRGGSGKMIKIRHNSTYQTAYLHLSRYAKGLRRGSKVEQGQIIGYVGSTGLATGPHLHFSFYENGRYVDPLGRKFPSADPVPKNQMPAFSAQVSLTIPLLPNWQLAFQNQEKMNDVAL